METKKLLDQIYLPPDIQFVPIAEIESRLWRGCIRFRNEEERATWGCNIQKNPLEKVVRRWRDSGALLVFAPGGLGRLVDGISDGVLRRPDFIKMVKDEFNLEVVDYSDEVPHAGTYSTPLVESTNITNTPERNETANAATTENDSELPHFATGALPLSVPVGAAASTGVGPGNTSLRQTTTLKRWTPEVLDTLRAYRDEHGTKKAAEHFAISTARVRELLPRPKLTRSGYSVFNSQGK
jgi:hypothetical protein